MNDKDKNLKKLMYFFWLGCLFFFVGLFVNIKVIPVFAVFAAGAIVTTLGNIIRARRNIEERMAQTAQTSKMPQQQNQTVSAKPPQAAEPEEEGEFDKLMSGQLIALYKKDNDEKYMKEYLRRLVRIGFDEKEAFNLFTNESMNMKHDSVLLLQQSDYLFKNYFDLQHKLLLYDNEYYIEHRSFCISEITKIWDEAEWHYHYSHEANMPDEVWGEIYKLTRYGGGELFINICKSFAQSTGIPLEKIQKYSAKEQDMLYKYKWYNEKGRHPYK